MAEWNQNGLWQTPASISTTTFAEILGKHLNLSKPRFPAFVKWNNNTPNRQDCRDDWKMIDVEHVG